MNEDLNTYSQIDAYLFGRMSETERASFEARMKSDAELKEMVELEHMTNEAIIQRKGQSLKSEVSEMFQYEKKKRIRKKGSLIGGIAIIAVVITIALNQNTGEKPDANPKITRTGTTSDSDNTPESIAEEESLGTKENEGVTKTLDPVDPKGLPSRSGQIIQTDSTIYELAVQNDTTASAKEQKQEPVEIAQEITGVVTKQTYHSTEKVCPEIEMSIDGVQVVCKDFSTSISVKVSGGRSPYKYYINEEEYKESLITDLYAGKYSLKVTDAHNCPSGLKEFEITEKRCYAPQKSFYPDQNSWKYESDGKEVSLTIMNSQGKKVFQTQGIDPEWYGNDQSGQPMKMDAYIYIIKDSQGNISTSTVTLIR